MMNYKDSLLQEWCICLLDSYKKFYGKELVERAPNPEKQVEIMDAANFVILSHNTDVSPILNFGNKIALQLWKLDWETFTSTPSTETAEDAFREKREKMLKDVEEKGFTSDYEGIRISSEGDRFVIKDVKVWNIYTAENERIGQAASFEEWEFL